MNTKNKKDEFLIILQANSKLIINLMQKQIFVTFKSNQYKKN